jgi:hypothetical protein
MKFWGLIVAFLYVFILVALLSPLAAVLFYSPHASFDLWQLWKNGDYLKMLHDIHVWCIFAMALITQGALLSVPVDITEKRPITKRTIVPLVVATSLMMTLLAVGVVFALCEVLKNDRFNQSILALLIGLILWGFWAFLFFRWSQKMEPLKFIDRQCRWLYRGSILELLIAVPAHIYVRQRHECCAGIGTFIGIACGIAVMLFSFGPGVFFLFRERIGRAKGQNEEK